MKQFVQTWWQHTPKAIAQGEPADRRFAVVAYQEPDEDGDDEGLLAWKCTALPDGRLSHPAFPGPLTPQEGEGWFDEHGNKVDPFLPGPAANGAEPTALFVPDSLYVLMV